MNCDKIREARMNKGVLGVLLICESLSGGDSSCTVVLSRIRELFERQHLAEESRPGSVTGRSLYLVPWCEGGTLFLGVFRNNSLQETVMVTLKEGSFVEDTVFLRDKTFYYMVDGDRKMTFKGKTRARGYPKRRQGTPWRHAPCTGLHFQKLHGAGSKLVQVHDETMVLTHAERLILLTCEAEIQGERVMLEVDVANFCDGDAWGVRRFDSVEWQESEKYILGVDVIKESGGIGLLV
jgi:hypothetical protein